LTGASCWRQLRNLCLVAVCTACALAVDVDELDNGVCANGTKPCTGADGRLSCVSEDLPSRGCANESCAPCVVENAIPRCGDDGRCGFSACLEGYKDCDGNPRNGCEVDTLHDPNHCGGCNAEPCQVDNGTAGCAAGSCAIDDCRDGYADCDDDPDNGCETDTATSDQHCGGCDQACDESESCEDGSCV